jgi:hypothetical protein
MHAVKHFDSPELRLDPGVGTQYAKQFSLTLDIRYLALATAVCWAIAPWICWSISAELPPALGFVGADTEALLGEEEEEEEEPPPKKPPKDMVLLFRRKFCIIS